MVNKNHIANSCTISNGTISKGGSVFFEDTDSSLPEFLSLAYRHTQLNYPKFYKMDNLSKLGWLAAEILLQGFDKGQYQPEEVGVVLTNANSSLDDDLKYFDTVKDAASPALFVYTLPNIVIGEICIRHKFKGEHAFFIQEEFEAGFLERQVNYLLDKHILKACVCGWVDVLDKDYKAVLFLVENNTGENPVSFSAKNMDRIFNTL